MKEKIRVGIYGYGNLGRGVELAVAKNEDMELTAVFTRRNPESLTLANPAVPVCRADTVEDYRGRIDVMILCGGSATDLPVQTPRLATLFNVVDSFDNHSRIPEHFSAVNAAARVGRTVAMISCGWDPGLFSLNRMMAGAVLPEGRDYTFWGKGISQGHSDAIRRVEGVADAKQYTIPVESAMEAVRAGEMPTFTTREKHLRECFVVAKEGADLEKIEQDIKTMPAYFADYDTTVHFVTQEELNKNHSGMPHGGFVIRSGKTAPDHHQVIEYSLKLESNPEFTGSVLVACARAVVRMAKDENWGCKTVLDVPPAYLSPKSAEELRAELL